MDWSEQQAKYGALVQPRQQTATATAPAPKKKKRGGVGGFLEGIAKSAAEPFSYLINSDIINPIKETSAILTGNKVAQRNATREANKEIGLGESGKDIVGGVKKLAGNSAQALLTAATPGVSSIKGGAALGTATGASAAITDRDSDLGDVLTGGLVGGATGGALSAGGKLLSKFTKTPKALGKTGEAIQAETSGITRGTPLKGGRTVTPEYETELNSFLQEGSKKYLPEGIKAGSPRAQSTSAQEVFNGVKTQLKENLDKINRKITPEEYNKLITDAEFKVNSTMGAEPGKYTADFKRLAKDKDIAGLEKLRQAADNDAFNLKGEVGGTAKAAEAHAIRDTIDEFVTSLSDSTDEAVAQAAAAYKAVKGDYGIAKDLVELTSKGAKTAKGAKVPLVGIDVGKQTIAGAKNKVGGFLNKVSNAVPEVALPGAVEATGNFANRALRQGITSKAGAVPENEPAADVADPLQPDIVDNTNFDTAEAPTEYDPFAPENLQASVQKILAQGGDMKDVTEFLNNAKILQAVNPANEKKKALNSTAAQTVSDLKSGIESIKQLGTDISESGVNNPVVGFLRSKNPLDTGAQSLQGRIALTKQLIGKALEGGVLRKEDEAKYAKILPTINDTDATAADKIANITRKLQERLFLYEQAIGSGDGGADISPLLTQGAV